MGLIRRLKEREKFMTGSMIEMSRSGDALLKLVRDEGPFTLLKGETTKELDGIFKDTMAKFSKEEKEIEDVSEQQLREASQRLASLDEIVDNAMNRIGVSSEFSEEEIERTIAGIMK